MVTGLFIPADPDQNLEIREITGLKDLQQAVDGWIEAVDIPQFGVTIYVNEEGLVRRLPFNSRASFLWWHHEPRSRRAMLVGDVIMVGLRDEINDYADVPSEVLDVLTTVQSFAVVLRLSEASASRIVDEEKAADVLLPLAEGNKSVLINGAQYPNYFAAAVWSAQLQKLWRDTGDAYVVPTNQLPQFVRQALAS